MGKTESTKKKTWPQHDNKHGRNRYYFRGLQRHLHVHISCPTTFSHYAVAPGLGDSFFFTFLKSLCKNSHLLFFSRKKIIGSIFRKPDKLKYQNRKK